MAPSSDTLDLEKLTQEDRIKLALEAHRINGISLRQAARTYNVPSSTLTSRAKGVLPRRQSHQHELKLTEAHESVLEQWCKVMGRRGVPITYQMLRDHASDISGQDVGATWPKRFMMRHPGLKIKYTTGLEQSRARSLNPNAVRDYFDLLTEILAEYNIIPENIYNMDEKGIQLGIGKRVAALVDRGQKTAYQVETGSRELITIIETISADGAALSPCVIFQGKRRNLEWGRENPCNAR
jgi:hypothetical protein